MAGGRGAVAAGRRIRILAMLGLAVLASLGGYRWYRVGSGAAAAAAAAPPLKRSAITIAPGIHMLGGLSPSAAYVVETSAGLILIDSGLARDAGPLRSEMARLGLDWRRIRAILLTHVHGDHTGGAESLRAATGAAVYAGAGDVAALRAGGPRDTFFSIFFMPDEVPHPTTVDVELHGGETIAVGDVRVQAIAAPGHTPGSMCYLAECRGLRVFFGGDVIMMLRGEESPRTELDKPLGTYSAYLPPHYRGDARKFLATLQLLRRLPAPDLVLPGHPRADRKPESPRMSQAQWESMFDRGIRDMETLLARYQADGADFLDGRPKSLLPDLDYLGDRDGWAVYAILAGSRLVLVDAPGGPGLADFVKTRLGQLGREPTPPSAVLLTGCGPEETAGLEDLIGECRTEVVAPAAGIARLRESCPAGTVISTAEDLTARGWFPVTAIPLEGRGWNPMAYRLTCDGKTVLFSGRIPVKLSQETGQKLIADLTHPPGDVRGYFDSLKRLQQSGSPDLWLPAVPTQGQNANLYDGDWTRELEANLGVVKAILDATRRR